MGDIRFTLACPSPPATLRIVRCILPWPHCAEPAEWSLPRQLSFTEAFTWWLERRILHEKTGDFIEHDDGMTEMLTRAGNILFDSETSYWNKEFKYRKRAAKEFGADMLKRQKGGAQ